MCLVYVTETTLAQNNVHEEQGSLRIKPIEENIDASVWVILQYLSVV
jgi:hypothetical protein